MDTLSDADTEELFIHTNIAHFWCTLYLILLDVEYWNTPNTNSQQV